MKLSEFILSPVDYLSGYSAWMEHAPFAFYLIEQLRPGVFVELGSCCGDSYCAFCQAIKKMGLPARAYAVDTFQGDKHSGKYGQDVYNRFKHINDLNYSHFSNILCSTFDEACQLFEEASIDLLHIDGLHTYEAVKHDYERWLPKMSDKGVIVFHDTAVTVGDFGVWKLMDELKFRFPYFEFAHGYGLGILCIGQKVPENFLAFIDIANKEPLISTVFHIAGQKIILENQVDVLKRSMDRMRMESEIKLEIISEPKSEILAHEEITSAPENEILVTEQPPPEHDMPSTTMEELSALAASIIPKAEIREEKMDTVKSRARSKATEVFRRVKTKIGLHDNTSNIYEDQVNTNILHIRKSDLFDPDYYLAENPDVRTSGMEPALHYLLHGGFEGRNPSAGFDSAFYMEEYPDVKASGINPLLHYILHGKQEKRKIVAEINLPANEVLNETDYVGLIRKSRLFSSGFYLDNNPDLQEAGVDPVQHYLEYGWKESRSPSWEFNTDYYLINNPDIRTSGMNPLVHYLLYGEKEGRKTHPFADSDTILEEKPRVLIISKEFQTPGHYYRVMNLLESFGELGIPAIWNTPELTVNQLAEYTHLMLLILWRTEFTSDIQTITNYAKGQGALIIFDMDDLLFDPSLAEPEQMDAIRSLHHGKTHLKVYCSRMQTTAWLADLCTGSTKEICDAFETLGKKSFILPNGYSRHHFTKSLNISYLTRHDPEIIRIGYAGGTLTHQRDFAVVVPALARILREFPQTRLTVFDGVLNKEEFSELIEFADRIDVRGLVPYPELQAEISLFDINIAPLEINTFCNAKSELKFFEAALLAIPTIASPTPPFQRCIRHGSSGFLAHTSEDWYNYLQRLVSDPLLRKSTGEQARTYVRWRFSPDERNLLVWNLLTILHKENGLSLEETGNKAHLIFPGMRLDFKPDDAPFDLQFPAPQRFIELKKPEIASTVGLVIFLNKEIEHVEVTLDSLIRQTAKGFDLLLISSNRSDEFRKWVDGWVTVNSTAINRLVLVEPDPGIHPAALLNFALELLLTDFFMVVQTGSYLFPDTIDKFTQILKESRAAAVTGNLADSQSGLAMFRSSVVIRIGGFDPDTPAFGDAIAQIVQKIPEKCHPVVNYHITTGFLISGQSSIDSVKTRNDQKHKTILFIGHDDFKAGAQVVLLNILRHLHRVREFRLILILIECKHNLKAEYEKVAEVICYDEIRCAFNDPFIRKAILSNLIGKVDLIYGNTVLSASLANELAFLQAPFIIHIHELESALRILLTNKSLQNLKFWPHRYISCSSSVTDNLIRNYQIDAEKISTIEEFIDPPVPVMLPGKFAIRENQQWDHGKFIVMGCGTINYRKGVDLFIQTAARLKTMGFTPFHFIWFGDNQWDMDASLWHAPSWEQCLKELTDSGLEGQVTFMGPVENIFDYIPAADLFYLPSREDPFPLVALEASFAGVPTLCFKGSGGIPEAFGEENILSAEMGNTEEAAEKMIEMAHHPGLFAALGKNAARLVTEKYTAEVSVPKIGSVIRHVITEDAASISNRVTVDIKKQAVTWAFITTNDGSSDGGSEKLWIQSALRCRQNGDRVLVVIKNWDPQPRFIHTFLEAGIKVLFKSDDPFRALQSIRPRLVVISIGDQDEGVEWYDFCRTFRFPYVIVNHLTKDPTVCPVNESHAAGLHRGYTAASRVLFTGQNNLRLMEKRLGVRIPGAGIFFNPIDVDRNHCVLYPDTSQGWHIAMVGALLDIHKGQSLAIRVMNIPKWRDRPVTLHLYGKGSDESNFRSMTEELRLSNVMLHGHVHDIPEIWRVNHLLLMSSRMEGLPLVLVAAMLSGRTAVVTDIGAHAEVIDDNRTGFLATAPTVEALDEALERAWLRRFEWQQMGEDAMSFIHQFIPEDPVGHFLKMIRHLIK